MLSLETLEGDRHPSYVFNLAGARELLALLDELPVESRLNNVGGGDVWLGAEPVWRPTDIEAFRQALLERIEFNHAAFNNLCDVLAAEPDYWLYFSV